MSLNRDGSSIIVKDARHAWTNDDDGNDVTHWSSTSPAASAAVYLVSSETTGRRHLLAVRHASSGASQLIALEPRFSTAAAATEMTYTCVSRQLDVVVEESGSPENGENSCVPDKVLMTSTGENVGVSTASFRFYEGLLELRPDATVPPANCLDPVHVDYVASETRDCADEDPEVVSQDSSSSSISGSARNDGTSGESIDSGRSWMLFGESQPETEAKTEEAGSSSLQQEWVNFDINRRCDAVDGVDEVTSFTAGGQCSTSSSIQSHSPGGGTLGESPKRKWFFGRSTVASGSERSHASDTELLLVDSSP